MNINLLTQKTNKSRYKLQGIIIMGSLFRPKIPAPPPIA